MRRARPSILHTKTRFKFAICNLQFAICNGSSRSGATLTEVLITLLIMAIGVVTCATLFPISVMRSVHATQLTNATILRHNAETTIDVNPLMIFDPDGNGNLQEHARTTGAGVASEPDYIIDPLGAFFARSNANPTPNRLGSIPRYGLGTLAQAPADQEPFATNLVTLRGSWTSLGEDVPFRTRFGTWNPPTFTPSDPQVVMFPQAPQPLNPDLAAAQQAANATNIWSAPADRVRAVIFDSTGRLSEIRTLTPAGIDPGARTIQWPAAEALPPDDRYYNQPLSNVRIETQDRNYTWMMTVRNNSDTSNPVATNWILNAEVDLAVFFRRSGAPADELIFSTTAGSPFTISGAGNQYTITWPQGSRPAIKKGGYVLDVGHARWFRIEALNETATSATFVLDRSPPTAMQEACFMRGLVEVFRIGKKSMNP